MTTFTKKDSHSKSVAEKDSKKMTDSMIQSLEIKCNYRRKCLGNIIEGYKCI